MEEAEYKDYIPGKCVFCGSSNISELLKKKIKGKVRDGFLWDMSCIACDSRWVALEKPLDDNYMVDLKEPKKIDIGDLHLRRQVRKIFGNSWSRTIAVLTVPLVLLCIVLIDWVSKWLPVAAIWAIGLGIILLSWNFLAFADDTPLRKYYLVRKICPYLRKGWKIVPQR